MLQAWCRAYDEAAPTAEILSPKSYVLEIDGIPALFISLITTNVAWAYLENYCGNPEFKGNRFEAVQHLIKHLETEAKASGHKALMTFSYKPKLKAAFEAYGFTRALDNMSAFVRSIN